MSEDRELTSMHVKLSAAEEQHVLTQAAATGCGTPSEYIRKLIQADQNAEEQDDLERALIAGLDSPLRQMGPAEWAEFRESLRAASARRRKAQ